MIEMFLMLMLFKQCIGSASHIQFCLLQITIFFFFEFFCNKFVYIWTIPNASKRFEMVARLTPNDWAISCIECVGSFSSSSSNSWSVNFFGWPERSLSSMSKPPFLTMAHSQVYFIVRISFGKQSMCFGCSFICIKEVK